MTGLLDVLSWAFFQPKNEAERKKKENARIDREIANKKLEIKRLKSKIQYRKKIEFTLHLMLRCVNYLCEKCRKKYGCCKLLVYVIISMIRASALQQAIQ